ncbi:MBL fold metallo-hydrolase [Salisaeta longa]|uniref:MBL fold metallo-hydrolase n=1 Tax=Salisaeta longa TaxID=503170 RepID=UPI0003B5D796|nr:MBL fold metallo-hydrolase [Salisaeta longa]
MMGHANTFTFAEDAVAGLQVGRFAWGPSTQAVCYRVGHTLIDTGPPNQWAAVRAFAEAQHAAHGIEQILLTHHHEDHAGNAARLAEHLDCPVYAPRASLDRLRDGFSIEWYRWVVWGRPTPVEARPLPDAPLALGDNVHAHPIAAPGHADDMVCYYVPERRWLFSADLFITPRPQYLRFDEDVQQLLASLHRVLEHPCDVLFCSHRGIVPDGRAALQRKARYLEALMGIVQRRRVIDQQSINHIRKTMLGREGWLRWVSGGDFSKEHLVASCLADDAAQPHEDTLDTARPVAS